MRLPKLKCRNRANTHTRAPIRALMREARPSMCAHMIQHSALVLAGEDGDEEVSPGHQVYFNSAYHVEHSNEPTDRRNILILQSELWPRERESQRVRARKNKWLIEISTLCRMCSVVAAMAVAASNNNKGPLNTQKNGKIKIKFHLAVNALRSRDEMTFYIIARYLVSLCPFHSLSLSFPLPSTCLSHKRHTAQSRSTHWYGNWKLELIIQFSIWRCLESFEPQRNRIQWPDQVFRNDRNQSKKTKENETKQKIPNRFEFKCRQKHSHENRTRILAASRPASGRLIHWNCRNEINIIGNGSLTIGPLERNLHGAPADW